MKHAREDYARIQDPALEHPELLGEGCSPIAEDEPVFLLRAKDFYMTRTLYCYLELLQIDKTVSPHMIEAVKQQINAADRWRALNGCKTPDMPVRKAGGE